MAKYNNRKFNIMLRFASTYFILIVIVLLCLLPIFRAFIRTEEDKVMQSIMAQAESTILNNTKTKEDLFTATRNLYNDPKLLEIYYTSTRHPNESLFYSMTQLHSRMNLYYQNMKDLEEIVVYIPKFNYVLTKNYIFDSKEEYYTMQHFARYPNTDWLAEVSGSSMLLNIYPDQYTDLVQSENPKSVLNFAYNFPQIGDANIRIFVLVSLSSSAFAKDFVIPDLESYSFALVGTNEGEILSSYQWNGGNQLPTGSSWTDESGIVYRLLSLHPEDSYPICIGIQETFFLQQKYKIACLLFRNIGAALMFGAAISLIFAYYRSRPIEHILTLLHSRSKQHEKNHWKAIEGELTNMMSEITQCKQTIQELDEKISFGLLEKFYLGNLTFSQIQESFPQYFGALPYSFIAVIFGSEDKNTDLLLRELPALLGFSDRHILFLHPHHNKVYSLLDAEKVTIQQISEALEQFAILHNVKVKAGVSDIGYSFEEVRSAVQQAAQRLKASWKYPNLTVLTHSPYAMPESFIQIQELDTLHHALLQGDEKIASRIIEGIFEKAQSNHFDQVDMRQLFFSLRVVYSNALHQLLRSAAVYSSNSNANADTNTSTKFTKSTKSKFQDLPVDLEEYSLDGLKSTFLSMNQQLMKLSEQNESLSAQTRAVNLVHYIEKNFQDPNLCATSLATQFQISEKYVFQLVKSASGETLNNYVSALRVQYALHLLGTTNLSIAEIAQESGFSSSNTMYKVFMRIKGAPPSSYRTVPASGIT